MNENTTPLTTTPTTPVARFISASNAKTNEFSAEFSLVVDGNALGFHTRKLTNGLYMTKTANTVLVIEKPEPEDYKTEKKTTMVKGYNGFEEKEIDVVVPPDYNVCHKMFAEKVGILCLTISADGNRAAQTMLSVADCAIARAGQNAMDLFTKTLTEKIEKGEDTTGMDSTSFVNGAKVMAFRSYLHNLETRKPYIPRKVKTAKAPRVKRIKTEDDGDTGGKKNRGKGDKNKPRKGGNKGKGR
jgi:hypothetical protein